MSPTRPGVDPELAQPLQDMKQVFPALNDEVLAIARSVPAPAVGDVLGTRDVEHRDVTVRGSAGAPDLTLALFTRRGDTPSGAPCFYWIHGGGMVLGNRMLTLEVPLDLLERFGGVLVSVEYRLAPQARGTDLVEDCYAGLAWAAAHAGELGIDPGRVILGGASAGGGLAAGVALLARDRGGPAILAQLLDCPMLDHRNTTVSARQYDASWGGWTREMNAYGWAAVLGDTPADQVSPYISPARATDLRGLPPAYIAAGSAELFRDEDVDYASRLWAAGGQAELHIWAGGFHGFDSRFPATAVSAAARASKTEWVGRQLAAAGVQPPA